MARIRIGKRILTINVKMKRVSGKERLKKEEKDRRKA